MKKIFLCGIISSFLSCNLYASDNEQIKNLTESIKNAPTGTITATNIPTFDDCVHTLVNKDGAPLFYERACFDIGSRFMGLDPIKDADYTFTIYGGDSETKIRGGYNDFQELIDLIQEATQARATQLEPQKSIFSQSCNPYGFDVITESDTDITVKYYDGIETQEQVFPKIFDDNGVRVYFNSDNNMFINKNGEWKNYGHRCTKMKQKSLVQEYDSEHQIKIVWFSEIKDPYILADLAADADPWGFSDVVLVYKQNHQEFDKTPSVFLRKAYGSIYVNGDMWIKYGENDDGSIHWKTSDTFYSATLR